jgi:hypothetical protein
VNRCAGVCPAIVETVATIGHINKAIFMFAVILSSRYELNPACSMKRIAKANNYDATARSVSCVFILSMPNYMILTLV